MQRMSSGYPGFQKIESFPIVAHRLFMPSPKLAHNAQVVVDFYGSAASLTGLSQFQCHKQIHLGFIELSSSAGFHADPVQSSNSSHRTHDYHLLKICRVAPYAAQLLKILSSDSHPVCFKAMNFFPLFLQTALTTLRAPWLLTEVMKTTISAPQTMLFSL